MGTLKKSFAAEELVQVLVWSHGGVGEGGRLAWGQEMGLFSSPSLGHGWKRGSRKAFVGAAGWKPGRWLGLAAMGSSVPPYG